ncbi:hypothetical protein Tco_0047691 [Tanacetum coccineum]
MRKVKSTLPFALNKGKQAVKELIYKLQLIKDKLSPWDCQGRFGTLWSGVELSLMGLSMGAGVEALDGMVVKKIEDGLLKEIEWFEQDIGGESEDDKEKKLVMVNEMEPDIENKTMNEYLEYEAAKERQLWDDVRSRRSPTNYNEADVNSFHRNKKTFSYPYSHNLTPPHPCFPPVQPYPKNYLVSTNESNDVDIENMTISEYNLYVAKQGLGMNPLRAENMKQIGHDIVQDRIWEQDDDSEEDKEEDDEIVQPVIPKPIHTTPPNDDYVAPTTKLILDELLEEFGDEILNVAIIDEEADFNPTKDLKELERLLAMRPQSNFMEIQVDRDIISPGRYAFYSSFPYLVAYLHPKGVYCYFHLHLIPSEGMDTQLPSK